MKIRTSGPTTPPRRRRGAAGGALYGAVKVALPAPTCLTGQQEDAQTNENHRPHCSPFDPAEDARVRGQQQHPERDEHDACRARMAPMMAMPLHIPVRTPPLFLGRRSRRAARHPFVGSWVTAGLGSGRARSTPRWVSSANIVGHASGLLGQALGLGMKLVGPVAPHMPTTRSDRG